LGLYTNTSSDSADVGKYQLTFGRGRTPWALTVSDLPPCNAACPAGVNAKAYIGLIRDGKFAEALEVVRERISLPGVIGRICSRPCERNCTRQKLDEPIAICALKRFLADYELRRGGRIVQRIAPQRAERVAIVGAGPAGLTAAYDLLQQGFGVTVFDEFDRPGGMLLAAIPEFRLPRKILSLEIGDILGAGVELKSGIRVGQDLGIEDLFKQGYKAVLIATGAHRGIPLGVEGDDLDGVMDAISFLRSVNLHGLRSIGKKVLVIGGGDSAIDSARCALRLGAEEVRIVYRRSRVEMPARDYEVQEATDEGVKIDFLVAPTKILGHSGKVSAIVLRKMRLGEPDSSGRRRPVPIEGSEFEVACDSVIAALGQRPDLGVLEGQTGIEIAKWGTVVTDELTCATSAPAVFAAGDIVSGPATAVEAIGAAHRAAEAIEAFLLTGNIKKPGEKRRHSPIKFEIAPATERPVHRIEPSSTDPAQRARSFDEVEMPYTVDRARDEASRCLMCGSCAECRRCVGECDGRYVAALPSKEEPSWDDRELIRIQSAELESLLGKAPLKAALTPETGGPAEERLVTPIVATADEELCIGCDTCGEVCPYTAIKTLCRIDGRTVPVLDSEFCRGCGLCIANCPTGALDQIHFSNELLAKAVFEAGETLVLGCLWAQNRAPGDYRALLDTFGKDARVIEVLCTGRVPAWLLLKALERGVKRIAIVACAEGKCRYGSSERVRDMVSRLKLLLEMLGLSSDILSIINLSEGGET